jgi:hypothetical protein
MSSQGKPEFDPFNAQSVADKLIQHYKKDGDKSAVERVLRTSASAFLKLSENATGMFASGWLQPVIERYEQEGMKEDANAVQMVLLEKQGVAANGMKHYSIPVEITKEEVDALFIYLIVDGDLGITLQNVAKYLFRKLMQPGRRLKNSEQWPRL